MYHITLESEENNIIIERVNDRAIPSCSLNSKAETRRVLNYYAEVKNPPTRTYVNCFPHNFK